MVSVITATIGRESLPKTCEMVDKQTYTDWEHVIVFDGKNAESQTGMKLSQRPGAEEDKRNYIIIEKSKYDHGKTPQNVGMIASKGDFITLLDDDNRWLPEHLESMMKPFQEDPTIQIVFCPLTMIHFNDNDYREERHFSISQGKVDAGNWVARREVLYRNGLFWAPHRRSYDWELLKKILTVSKEKFHVIEERNFLYYTPKKWHIN